MINILNLENPYEGLNRLRVHPPRTIHATAPLTNKQKKARNKSKSARKARKNR
jgi:hypothetical protein